VHPSMKQWCVWRSVWAVASKKRDRDKLNSQLLPTITCVGCFEDLIVKPCLIKLQSLLKILHSYFFNLNGEIVYWRLIESSRILWRVVVHKKFLLPSVSVFSKIQWWNISNCSEINFYWSLITYSNSFWTIGFEIGAIICFQKICEQWQFFWWWDS